jgi:hypothetical protein
MLMRCCCIRAGGPAVGGDGSAGGCCRVSRALPALIGAPPLCVRQWHVKKVASASAVRGRATTLPNAAVLSHSTIWYQKLRRQAFESQLECDLGCGVPIMTIASAGRQQPSGQANCVTYQVLHCLTCSAVLDSDFEVPNLTLHHL